MMRNIRILSMPEVKVLIIGCGVAGPVLAHFLKRKGYTPIVFEKVTKLGDAGASLMLMPNGLKVLGLAGILPEIQRDSIDLQAFVDKTANDEVLGTSSIPTTFKQKYGTPGLGVKRTELNLKLKSLVEELGVDVREGWELDDVEETDDSVTAHFKGRESVTGSFLIGCDGIKAASRRVLLGKTGLEEGLPEFTGLTQTAGLSPTPVALGALPAMRNWYGEGVHVISYPVSPTVASWAITLPEGSGQEAAWGLCTAEEIEERKRTLSEHVKSWSDGVPYELITSATRIIKFGIYDREEMKPEQWHSRRCVLVGDAAHPTSPHLGQGANQALEDCYTLSNALPSLDATDTDYEGKIATLGAPLTEIFQRFAEKRQPRTAALVKGARAQGNQRVVTTGPEDCRRRDEQIKAVWADSEAIRRKYDALLSEPFQHSSQ
ncbi:hypothetical protein LTR84_001852 [Exophiala bonariae]|uniref:FAD-binding domain-containing protein n=1 Tax=Exophiala bonariae TaxID=1690606 RepID=A0AAV9NBI9_9EURO|nr:hypothetical protein LTR84_001852 [Exophiala bonariae]